MRWRNFIIFISVLVLLGVLSVYLEMTGEVVKEIKYEREPAFVTHVVDGDTIEAVIGDGKIERIRLLGVNAPERGKPYYSEAKAFLAQIENKSVEILRDNEDVDKYNRKLRYVFYKGAFVNFEILENGFGTSFMVEGLDYEDKLLRAEDSARKRGIRLWKRSRDICARCVELVELEPFDEFFEIKNSCGFDCGLSGWTVKDNANHFFKLNDLEAGREERYESKSGQHIWNNAGDRFFMRDADGLLVLFWEY